MTLYSTAWQTAYRVRDAFFSYVVDRAPVEPKPWVIQIG